MDIFVITILPIFMTINLIVYETLPWLTTDLCYHSKNKSADLNNI